MVEPLVDIARAAIVKIKETSKDPDHEASMALIKTLGDLGDKNLALEFLEKNATLYDDDPPFGFNESAHTDMCIVLQQMEDLLDSLQSRYS